MNITHLPELNIRCNMTMLNFKTDVNRIFSKFNAESLGRSDNRENVKICYFAKHQFKFEAYSNRILNNLIYDNKNLIEYSFVNQFQVSPDSSS